jgi:hypothetical protein
MATTTMIATNIEGFESTVQVKCGRLSRQSATCGTTITRQQQSLAACLR